MLIVLGGLSGTGKTTLAKALAARLPAVLVRIDSIEQAAVDSGAVDHPVGEIGYRIGYAVAADNLLGGATVIANSVNPIEVTRRAWCDVARRADRAVLEVEIVCTDAAEHRRRVEARASDISGLPLPSWNDVMSRQYEPWNPDVTVDTAVRSITDCLAEILARLR